MLIDTHAHINDVKLTHKLNEIINDLESKEVNRVICPSYSFDSAISALELSKKHDKVYCALGIHPDEAKDFNEEFKRFVELNSKEPKVVAIGEIGLDYHREGYDKNLQRKVLINQINLASHSNLPLIFHVRDAFDDFFEIIKDFKGIGGVIHCFEGGEKELDQILQLDLYVSLTCILTYPERDALRNAIKDFPLDRIMLETDSPYLRPLSAKGLNHPQNTLFVAQTLAEIKNIDVEEVKLITTQTAYKFFGKMRDYETRI